MNVKEALRKTDVVKQVAHLRRENARLQSEIDRRDRTDGAAQLLAKSISESVEALDPLPAIAYRVPHHLQSKTKMAAAIKFSDWHIGERIRKEETEGFGEFSYRIAEDRVQEIAKKIIGWTATHRLAFEVPRLYVLCEGDFISGDIHDELRRTNEFPTPMQAVKAGRLLGQAVATLAPHFPEVVLVEVGGDNHSRLTVKPQAKQKALNSFGTVVYAMANELLSKHGNIEIQTSDAMTYLADVNGVKFLCEHGDTIKAWMGIPYYGIERHRGREAVRRQIVRKKRDIGFDYISCGHWHVPGIVSGNILINGSLCGTTEYDHACGRHADPAQVSFMVHPRYGIFDWTAWQTAQWAAFGRENKTGRIRPQ